MAIHGNEFGGCAAIQARASGFFRVEEIGGRWWFVTPPGEGFLSVAANHLEASFLDGSYNRQHWAEVLGDAPAAYTAMAVSDARSWNMIALGYGNSYSNPRFPYVARVSLPGLSTWQEKGVFPDPFSPAFEVAAREAARKVCAPLVDDPFLIGYFLNDCLEWPQPERASKRRGGNWLDALKGGDFQSDGKTAYVALMKARYGDQIGAFNRVYATDFSSFEELAGDTRWFYQPPAEREAARADDEAFTEILARRVYQIGSDAIRAIDANHLILGETLEGNRGIPDAVLDAARECFDVLSVQFYGVWKDQAASVARWHARTGLPVLLADSCFSVATDAMPRPCGPQLESQVERADAFERYARQILPVPHVVGWHWCGYIDGSLELEPRHQHMGLKDAWGEPHQPLCDRIHDVYNELYALAQGKSAV